MTSAEWIKDRVKFHLKSNSVVLANEFSTIYRAGATNRGGAIMQERKEENRAQMLPRHGVGRRLLEIRRNCNAHGDRISRIRQAVYSRDCKPSESHYICEQFRAINIYRGGGVSAEPITSWKFID